MIRFTRIEVQNFVCFEDLVIEPSTDPERPLTVIRAENASGKTTFLRAVRWGMYGEEGLPGDQTSYGVHPTFWEPDGAGIESRVSIEFTTDGSTRHHTAPGSETRYRLTRTVRTIARDDDPGYQRISELAQLMTKTPGGDWTSHTYGAEHVIGELLPWELRDFFVMDADEAAEFVGGSEGQTISRGKVEEKTTYAINALLGITVFRQAAKRVGDAQQVFGKKATNAIGDSDLNVLQAKLDETRLARDELKEKYHSGDRALAGLKDKLVELKDRRDKKLVGIGELTQLKVRLDNNERDLGRANVDYDRDLVTLAGQLEAPSLFAKLVAPRTQTAMEFLQPQYDSGLIPQRHIQFVGQLLENGTCVCGQDLASPGTHRDHVEAQLTTSAKETDQANFLGHLFEAARDLSQQAQNSDWPSQAEAAQVKVAEAEKRLSDLRLEKEELDTLLRGIDETEITVLQNEIETFEGQIIRQRANNNEMAGRLPSLRQEHDKLNKQVHARQNNELAASAYRRSEDLAAVVHEVLTNAYEAIQSEQVEDLSAEMNRLFANMVDNVTEDDSDLSQAGKETIRTISQVGVRPTTDGNFEIFAINNHGRDKPHIEINGASRRVIALSFVLALCSESQTRAPLIADSLLNMMSGAVRRNTLQSTAEKSRQPILLLTYADLESQTEVDTIAARAGATYTLTAQWHGVVMNQTDSRAISLACTCAPRQYCDVCEREGQANRPSWNRRN